MNLLLILVLLVFGGLLVSIAIELIGRIVTVLVALPITVYFLIKHRKDIK